MSRETRRIPSRIFAKWLLLLPILIVPSPLSSFNTHTPSKIEQRSRRLVPILETSQTSLLVTSIQSNSRYNKRKISRSNFIIKASSVPDSEDIQLYRKPKQKRRKLKKPKRPRAFWKDINNIESELRLFWTSINVDIPFTDPPPIPNEALLNHFERHDLRYAISNNGGRVVIAEKLGGANLIPGKWSDAVKDSKEIQCLLQPDNPAGAGLSYDIPPIAPFVKGKLVKGQVKKVKKSMHELILKSFLTGEETGDGIELDEINFPNEIAGIVMNDDSLEKSEDDILGIANMNEEIIRELRYPAGERWAQQDNRKPRGYWNKNVLVSEVYEYLTYAKETKGRPSVWMARPSEISEEGRDDLKQAITRFGGTDYICEIAGLVPPKEWIYFESQLELFLLLDAYLTKHHGDENASNKRKKESKTFFPKLLDIQKNGHGRLYDLVMDFGGRKMVATRLDMEYQAQTKVEIFQGLSYGKFDLKFAIKLLFFIRKEMVELDPSFQGHQGGTTRHIQMPSTQYLVEKGETQLAKDVQTYGGHESIARRLQLSFDPDEAQCDQIRAS